MSVAIDINSARRNRLRGLVKQLGLSRSEAAALLRSLAEEVDPREEFSRLREVAPAIASKEPRESQPERNRRAERQRRYRLRRKADVRILRAYPGISDETVAALVQHGFISADVVDRDAELTDALISLLGELADALNQRPNV